MAQILLQRVTWRNVAPFMFENVVVFGTIAGTATLMIGQPAGAVVHDSGFLLRVLLVALVAQFCLYLDDLYDARTVGNPQEFTIRLFKSMGIASLILGALYLLFPNLRLGPGVFVVGMALAIVILTTWDAAFSWLTVRLGPRERLLLVGTKPAALELARELGERRSQLGVEVVGFVEPENRVVRAFLPRPGIIGRVTDIPDIIRKYSVDRVVVSLTDARGKLPMDRLLDMKLSGVRFDHLASVYEEFTGKIAVESLRPSWLIFSEGFRRRRMHLIAKRAVDAAVASLGLVLGLPIIAIVAIAVRVSSPGGALYHQVRTGLNGRPFTLHKFRTMRKDAEAGTGAVWAREADCRVTPIGRILRKTRLDELPQLWNVLRGDMSLVGPRPERPEFIEQLTQEIPFYGQRHVVQPGLTGWAQVRYTYGASVEDAMEKLQFDLFYVKNMSIFLDLLIMFATLKIILLRRGSR
jgi:sugar transferase (PEP-CTERM system associated)